MARSCCHGATRADGRYRTDSYEALFGSGTHTSPDLVAGNPNCVLVRRCRPRNSMFELGGLTVLDYEMLENWVAGYSARW